MSNHDTFDLFDNEEMVRFQKALTPCRNCNHPKMTHSFLGMFKGIGKCVDAKVTANGTYNQCYCKEFLPKDNLEYLEYKYDKKRKGR
jgi:hypothetical protein